jgi:hypothetical protein
LIQANLPSTTTTKLTLTGPQATTFAPNITFTAPAVNVTASPATVIARNAKPKPRFVLPRQGFNQTSIYVEEVPAYATYCPDASAYSSACSCIGITQATVTAAAATFVSTVVETLTPITTITPVITYTPTVVITSTVTVTPCSAGKTFCGDTCVDLTQDDNNCGACSNVVGPSSPFLISLNTDKTSSAEPASSAVKAPASSPPSTSAHPLTNKNAVPLLWWSMLRLSHRTRILQGNSSMFWTSAMYDWG